MSQTWRLSQEANKSSGFRAVCLATRQLHHRDGGMALETIHAQAPTSHRSALVNSLQLPRVKPRQLMPPVQGLSLRLSFLVTESW